MELHDKVAVITGGASGIGLNITQKLMEKGVRVVICDIDERSANSVADELNSKFEAQAKVVPMNVTDEQKVKLLLDDIYGDYGKIDILVNNAGLQYISSIDEFPVDRWRKLVDILLTAPFILTQAVLPYMRKQQSGTIINMASIHGYIASEYKSAYIAAKHGLVGFTKATAVETAEDGITVNAICPGFVDTPLIRNQLAELGKEHNMSEEEALTDILLARVPQKRLIQPSEITELALFLVSEVSPSITGQGLLIDGGVTIQ